MIASIPDDTFVGLSSLIQNTPQVADMSQQLNPMASLSDIINTVSYARPLRARYIPSGISYLDIAQQQAQNAQYDQAKRLLPFFFDCSSFIGRALQSAGYNVPAGITTADMPAALINAGFKQYPLAKEQLQPGDILWGNGHAEFYYGNGQTIGAHNSRTGVGITNAFGANGSNPYGYTHFFRIS